MTRHSFSIPAWENATRPLLAAKAEVLENRVAANAMANDVFMF
jgi:hypothetical protein